MRKLLAVLLAAIMLVGALAVLPVGAADAQPLKSKFDGTTSDYTPSLVITEVLVNSKTGHPDLDDQLKDETDGASTEISPDAFDYIEIYNASDDEINLYEYKLLRANGKEFAKKKGEKVGQFERKVDLISGTLFDYGDVGFTWGTNCHYENPEHAQLKPGDIAIIWFYGEDTMALADKLAGIATVDRNYFVDYYNKLYIENYGMPLVNAPETMPEDKELVDYLPDNIHLIAVPGVNGANKTNSFKLESGYTYALANDSFAYDFPVAPATPESVVKNAWSEDTEKLPYFDATEDQIVCMADYVVGTAAGVMKEEGMDDMAAYYVPSNCTPDVLNAVNEATKEGATAKVYQTYVEAEFTYSYRSTAIVSAAQKPSPGTMPAWQWAYVDAVGKDTGEGARGLQHMEAEAWTAAGGDDAKYQAAMQALVTDWKTNTAIKKEGRLDVTPGTDGKIAWSTACVATLCEESIEITGEGGKKEDAIDYKKNFVSREELEKRHKKKTGGLNGEGGLPIWALILIIVGGVVLLGGIAVVVIILIKKKNKPVAADDVAAEGEIEIVDETATTEAPADETTNE